MLNGLRAQIMVCLTSITGLAASVAVADADAAPSAEADAAASTAASPATPAASSAACAAACSCIFFDTCGHRAFMSIDVV